MSLKTSRCGITSNATEKKYRPTSALRRRIQRGRFGSSTARTLGPSFLRQTKNNLQSISKDSARAVGTPAQARELSDVSSGYDIWTSLGIDIQVIYNSLWITPLTSRPDVEIALCWSWNRWLGDIWRQGESRLRWTCVVPVLTPSRSDTANSFRQRAWRRRRVHAAIRTGSDGDRPISITRSSMKPSASTSPSPSISRTATPSFQVNDQRSRRRLLHLSDPTVTSCYALIMSEIPRDFPGFAGDSSRCRASGFPGSFMRPCGDRWEVTNPVSTDCLREYNIYVSTQSDDDFAYVITYSGEENLVIGTDYGHGDTSSELNAIARFRAIEGLSETVKRKILSDNPRRFYGI